MGALAVVAFAALVSHCSAKPHPVAFANWMSDDLDILWFDPAHPDREGAVLARVAPRMEREIKSYMGHEFGWRRSEDPVGEVVGRYTVHEGTRRVDMGMPKNTANSHADATRPGRDTPAPAPKPPKTAEADARREAGPSKSTATANDPVREPSSSRRSAPSREALLRGDSAAAFFGSFDGLDSFTAQRRLANATSGWASTDVFALLQEALDRQSLEVVEGLAPSGAAFYAGDDAVVAMLLSVCKWCPSLLYTRAMLKDIMREVRPEMDVDLTDISPLLRARGAARADTLRAEALRETEPPLPASGYHSTLASIASTCAATRRRRTCWASDACRRQGTFCTCHRTGGTRR